MLLNDIYDRLNPRPRTRGYQVVQAHGVAPLIDLMIAHHEAAHCVFSYINGRRVHDVSISPGRGAGEFRSVPNPKTLADEGTPEGGAELIGMMAAARHAETRRQWLRDVVGYAVGRAAQRKFGAKDEYYDSFCRQDYQIINRVLHAITRDPERKARYLRQVEDDAEVFVYRHWNEICKLAAKIYRRGTLDKRQIAAVLGKHASEVVLNDAGAQLAYDLVCQNKLDWGGFAWDSDVDGEALLDEEGQDTLSKYHLGMDSKATGTSKYHFPFTKTGGEVYVKALLDAEKQGGPVGQYAAQLLDQITAMKEQSEANTTKPRGWGRALPRQPGDKENFRRRCDGYIKL
jgi:hypothetical protein